MAAAPVKFTSIADKEPMIRCESPSSEGDRLRSVVSPVFDNPIQRIFKSAELYPEQYGLVNSRKAAALLQEHSEEGNFIISNNSEKQCIAVYFVFASRIWAAEFACDGVIRPHIGFTDELLAVFEKRYEESDGASHMRGPFTPSAFHAIGRSDRHQIG